MVSTVARVNTNGIYFFNPVGETQNWNFETNMFLTDRKEEPVHIDKKPPQTTTSSNSSNNNKLVDDTEATY